MPQTDRTLIRAAAITLAAAAIATAWLVWRVAEPAHGQPRGVDPEFVVGGTCYPQASPPRVAAAAGRHVLAATFAVRCYARIDRFLIFATQATARLQWRRGIGYPWRPYGTHSEFGDGLDTAFIDPAHFSCRYGGRLERYRLKTTVDVGTFDRTFGRHYSSTFVSYSLGSLTRLPCGTGG
jgi:hypothetical protein